MMAGEWKNKRYNPNRLPTVVEDRPHAPRPVLVPKMAPENNGKVIPINVKGRSRPVLVGETRDLGADYNGAW